MNDVKKIYVTAGIMIIIFVTVLIYLRNNSNGSIADNNESVLGYESMTTVNEEDSSEVVIAQDEFVTEASGEFEESSMFTNNLSDYVGLIIVSTFVAKEDDLDSILSVAYEDYSEYKAMYLWRTGFNVEDGAFINISTYDSVTGEFLSYTKSYTGEEVLNDDISDILYYEEKDNSITVYK